MPWPPTNSPATPYSLHVRWFSGLFVYHAVWFHGMWGVGLWAGMHREAPVSARLTVRRLWNTRSRRNAPRGMPPQVAGAYRRHPDHTGHIIRQSGPRRRIRHVRVVTGILRRIGRPHTDAIRMVRVVTGTVAAPFGPRAETRPDAPSAAGRPGVACPHAGPPDHETVGRDVSDGHRPTDARAPSRQRSPGRRVDPVRKNGGSRSDRTERPARAPRPMLPDPPVAPTYKEPAGQTSPTGHVPARAHGSSPPRSCDEIMRHDAGRVRRPAPWHLWMRAFRNSVIRSKCMPEQVPSDGAQAYRHRHPSRSMPVPRLQGTQNVPPAPLFRPQPGDTPVTSRSWPEGAYSITFRFFCAL